MKLDKRAAIVTGASQGFGLAVAEAFAAEGAEVLMWLFHPLPKPAPPEPLVCAFCKGDLFVPAVRLVRDFVGVRGSSPNWIALKCVQCNELIMNYETETKLTLNPLSLG